jgi:hypothetical protein
MLQEHFEQFLFQFFQVVLPAVICLPYEFDPKQYILLFFSKKTGIRIGYILHVDVIGTMMTVFNPCISFGEITTQGRVFLISLPDFGSKFIR